MPDDLARRRALLTAAVGFALLDRRGKPAPSEVRAGSVVYAVPMMTRRLLLLLLAGSMVALTPAALASPPDQHWLAGLYDDADYDDVILAIVESVASVELQPSHNSQFGESTVAFLLLTAASLHAAPLLSSNHTRAPPAS